MRHKSKAKTAITSVLTGVHLIARMGKREELAWLACRLFSHESSVITGVSNVINGRSLAWHGQRVE